MLSLFFASHFKYKNRNYEKKKGVILYFLVKKLRFESEHSRFDNKEMKSLENKLRSRFPVCARASADFHKLQIPELIVSSIHRQESSLVALSDKIEMFCEDSGYGRLEEDMTFIDHIDLLFQDQDQHSDHFEPYDRG